MALWLVVFAMAVQMSAGLINCANQFYTMNVGEESKTEGWCTLPQGGCSEISIDSPVEYYAATPIIGTNSFDMIHGLDWGIKVAHTFRGFDNMIGGEGVIVHTFTQKISCTTNVANATEIQLYNTTVRMWRPSLNAAALEPPPSIPVGCLVEDVETRVLASLRTPNASASYHSLIGNWHNGDDMPWVSSRPSSVTRWSPHATDSWDGGSQQILRSIMAGPNSSSVWLVLKPPSSRRLESKRFLQGSNSVSWKVCIIPGDGYNYYDELCTEQFPVMRSQAECDAVLPTSSATPRSEVAMGNLALAIVIIAFFAADK